MKAKIRYYKCIYEKQNEVVIVETYKSINDIKFRNLGLVFIDEITPLQAKTAYRKNIKIKF